MTDPIYTLPQIVERLQRLDSASITVDNVTELLSEGTIDEASLARWVHFRDDRYCRSQIFRNDHFEVLVLTWKAGHGTSIHNHSGNLGWVRVLRGEMREERFELEGGGSVPNLFDLFDCISSPLFIYDASKGHGAQELASHGARKSFFSRVESSSL